MHNHIETEDCTHTWDDVVETIVQFAEGQLPAKSLRALLAEPVTPTEEQLVAARENPRATPIYEFTLMRNGRRGEPTLMTYYQGIGVMCSVPGNSDVIVHHGEGAEERKQYILNGVRSQALDLKNQGQLPRDLDVERIVSKMRVRETVPGVVTGNLNVTLQRDGVVS